MNNERISFVLWHFVLKKTAWLFRLLYSQKSEYKKQIYTNCIKTIFPVLWKTLWKMLITLPKKLYFACFFPMWRTFNNFVAYTLRFIGFTIIKNIGFFLDFYCLFESIFEWSIRQNGNKRNRRQSVDNSSELL